MLERLAEKNAEKVKILKVDVSSEREWAASEKIAGIPAFQIYKGGKKVKEFKGAPPEAQLQKVIDECSAEAVSPISPMPKDWLPPGVTRSNE